MVGARDAGRAAIQEGDAVKLAAQTTFKVGVTAPRVSSYRPAFLSLPECPSRTFLRDRDIPFALGHLIRTLSPGASKGIMPWN